MVYSIDLKLRCFTPSGASAIFRIAPRRPIRIFALAYFGLSWPQDIPISNEGDAHAIFLRLGNARLRDRPRGLSRPICTEAALAMVKEAKFYRKQAEKAERMSLALTDIEAAQNLSALAQAYRSQADMLKKSKKAKKKPGSKRR